MCEYVSNGPDNWIENISNKPKQDGEKTKTKTKATELVPFEMQIPHTQELCLNGSDTRMHVTLNSSISTYELRETEGVEFKVLVTGFRKKEIETPTLEKKVLTPTLVDLKKEKKELEGKIIDLITAFQVKYAIGFKDIRTGTVQTSGGVVIISKLNVEVEL